MGPRVGLDVVVKRKIPNSCRDSNARSSIPYHRPIPLGYPGSSGRGISKICVQVIVVSIITESFLTEFLLNKYTHSPLG
jgi:hypothetical protein